MSELGQDFVPYFKAPFRGAEGLFFNYSQTRREQRLTGTKSDSGFSGGGSGDGADHFGLLLLLLLFEANDNDQTLLANRWPREKQTTFC